MTDLLYLECSRMSIHALWFAQEYGCHIDGGYINISGRNDIFVFVSVQGP